MVISYLTVFIKLVPVSPNPGDVSWAHQVSASALVFWVSPALQGEPGSVNMWIF